MILIISEGKHNERLPEMFMDVLNDTNKMIIELSDKRDKS
jgi:hypothetical protein